MQAVVTVGSAMIDEKIDISKIPVPIKLVSRGNPDRDEWLEPNWILWKQKTKIMLWEAAFLCFDIEPNKRSYLDIDHYDLHTLEIGVCLALLKNDLFLKEFFSVPYTHAQGVVSNFDLVKLPELAAWAINRGYDIPEELAALAKKLDTDTVAHSENQDANLYPNKKQTQLSKNRAFLQECIDKGISPDIESIWKHIIENAGKPNFLFKTASKITAITINEHQVRKKNLARRLKRFLNKPKTN
jgi:hypothetical protein